MKKILILLIAGVTAIVSCSGPQTTPSNTDSTKVPVDTVKIDTVKPTDSIIKG